MTDNIVTERPHAKLGPSGAYRWSNCPGSVVLCEGMPDNGSHYARWGTAAHELASIVMEPFDGMAMTQESIAEFDKLDAEAYIGRVFIVEGERYEVDGDMATCVNDYLGHVSSYLVPGAVLMVEQALPIEHITGEKGATGTGDALVVIPGKELVSVDLKTGQGVIVDAQDNKQCLMYLEGAVYATEPIYGPYERFTSVISQPRAEHLSEWSDTAEEHNERVLYLSLQAQDVWKAKQARGTGPLRREWVETWLEASPEACRFCKAKSICPALRGEVSAGLSSTAAASPEDFPDLSVERQAEAALDGVTEGADALTSADLADALRAAPMIEDWLKAVRAEAYTRALDGDELPGYKLVMGKRGARTWSDTAQAEDIMRKARVKADEMFNRTLVTFPQAEKLLKDRPRIWSKLAPLMTQAEGKPSLAPADDPRPVYTPQVAAAEDFPELDAGGEVDPFS